MYKASLEQLLFPQFKKANLQWFITLQIQH